MPHTIDAGSAMKGPFRNFVGMGANKRSQHVSFQMPMRGMENISQFETIDVDHKPSWKQFGGGSGSLKAEAHHSAGWLQFHIRETPDTGRGGKDVYFTLNPEAATAFRNFLNAVLENSESQNGKNL